MVDKVLLGAYALVWLALAVVIFIGEVEVCLKDESSQKELAKSIADESATDMKEMKEMSEGAIPPSTLAYILLMLHILFIAFDLGGFAVAAWVVELSDIQDMLYWITLTATLVFHAKWLYETAKITAEIAQDEAPEYVERVTRELLEDESLVTPVSFASSLGRVALAVLAVMSVFFT